MLKEQINKYKNYFKNDEGNNKKKTENLVVFVIILIVTIIIINMILKDDKNKNGDTQMNNTTKVLAKSQEEVTDKDNDEEQLKKDLEDILSKIDGVGETKVLITYSQTNQILPLYNEDLSTSDTEEKDTRWWKQEN